MNINKRNPSLPSKEDVQRIKTEAAAMAQQQTEGINAPSDVLYCGNAITTALKKSVNASRLKTYNLEIQLLNENILIMQGVLAKACTVAVRQRLHAAIQSSQRKVATRLAEIQKLPLQSEINKHSITRWSWL